MDNKAQQSPLLDKKKITLERIQKLEEIAGFGKNPDWADWENTEIVGEGGEELLSALQNYRSSFQVLKKVWKDLYGEELK